MRSATICFAIGVALLQQQASLLAISSLLSLSLLLAFLLLLSRKLKAKRSKASQKTYSAHICLCFAFGLLGFIWASAYAHWRLQDALPAHLEGQDIYVTGTIASLPFYNLSTRSTRFQMQVETADWNAQALNNFPKKILVSWYGQGGSLRPGQRWRLMLRLKRPHGNANPYGFDYEAWLLEQGVRATASVVQKHVHTAVMQEEFVWSLNSLIGRARYALQQRIHNAMSDKPYAGMMVALVIGEQREVAQSDWTVFNRTGVSHLISISGLHITLIAGMCSSLMFALWRRSFFTSLLLPNYMPAQKVAAMTAVCVALLYVALSGFGVPAQRTLYMLMAVAWAMWRGRVISVSHSVCLALMVVLVLDPWAMLWPGFWLSFVAVSTLVWSMQGREIAVHQRESVKTRLMRHLLNATRLQLALSFALIPLTLFLFAQVSLISPLANALAIPLVSFVVTPMALLGAVLPEVFATFVLSVAHACMDHLFTYLRWLNTLDMAVWRTPVPAWWKLILASLGCAYALLPKGFPLRAWACLCCLPLVIPNSSDLKYGELNVIAFDVGQGSALLLETQNHRLLYDTGPSFSVESNAATRVVLPYLYGKGIARLDRMMLSHGDMDHIGGANSVLHEISVGQIQSSLPSSHELLNSERKKFVPHLNCIQGQSWSWDGVRFEVLHPSLDDYLKLEKQVNSVESSSQVAMRKAKSNSMSCVLKVSTPHNSILLLGDIERAQENKLLQTVPQQLQANIVIAPHHGSGTSSSLPFLLATDAKYAIFQVGYRNPYRHPKTEVWQRYVQIGIHPLRTDQEGAIQIQLGASLNLQSYRSTYVRYWHEKGSGTMP
jgi:competence protein ComEC